KACRRPMKWLDVSSSCSPSPRVRDSFQLASADPRPRVVRVLLRQLHRRAPRAKPRVAPVPVVAAAAAAVRLLRRVPTSRTRCRRSRAMKRLLGFSLAGIIVVGAGVLAQQSGRTQNAVPDGDWRTINRDLAANRYSPLKQINASNVSSLKEAWTTRLGGGGTSVPLVINGVMYVSSGTRVVALDGDTGKEIWRTCCSRLPLPLL